MYLMLMPPTRPPLQVLLAMYSGSYPIRMGAMFLVLELLDKVQRGELEEATWEELSPGEQFVRAFAMLQQNLGKSAGFKMWSELGETMARWAAGPGWRGRLSTCTASAV
jgi:hypothetical protein